MNRKSVTEVSIVLNREETEVLGRLLALAKINIDINPQAYDIKTHYIISVLDKLDYQMHEVADWCSRSDCSYWTKKKAKESSDNEDKIISQKV